jgi:putative ABC transport system permease protein
MFAYRLELALRSFRRNVVLTVLLIAAVGVGIGASMTMLTTLVAMSANPIPDKSSQLFVPQIDVYGDVTRDHIIYNMPRQLTYRDAIGLMKLRPNTRQAAMYSVSLNVRPLHADPFLALGRATGGDFFSMFEVPFRAGAPWSRTTDDGRDNVVVLSARLADRLFPGTDAVGRTVNLGKRDYRVVAVIRPWSPTPRFYDESAGAFNDGEDFFMPFSVAVDRQIEALDYGCDDTELPAEWAQRLSSECPWVQLWVELPTSTQVRSYRTDLQNYAAEQQRLGRFHWLPAVELRNVTQWLDYLRIVPNEVRVNSMIAVGFLVVCLINAVGLMLAKFSSRAMELSVRRAMGASRADLFLQCLTETMMVGLLGGLLGLGLTGAGLAALRGLRGVTSSDSAAAQVISLNVEMVVITFAVATLTTICSGLYPAWRTSRVPPAWQLKAQ